MASSDEYVIDGEAVNKLLEAFQLNPEMLPGQVFDMIEKKLIKSLADDIAKAKPQTVRFVNFEAIPNGPHKDFTYAICGGLAELIDSLAEMKITPTGAVRNSQGLPWNFVSRIDKNFKGLGSFRD
jgi:hypothetical protein